MPTPALSKGNISIQELQDLQKLPSTSFDKGTGVFGEAELLKITSLAPTQLNEIRDENEDSFDNSSETDSSGDSSKT